MKNVTASGRVRRDCLLMRTTAYKNSFQSLMKLRMTTAAIAGRVWEHDLPDMRQSPQPSTLASIFEILGDLDEESPQQID